MFSLTDRCRKLRNEAMNEKKYLPKYALWRSVYFQLGLGRARAAGLERAEANAAGIANILDSFTPFIIPGELIVGHGLGDADQGDPGHWRFGGEWYEPKNTPDGREEMRLCGISEADIEEYFLNYEKGREEIVWPSECGNNPLPEFEPEYMEEEAAQEYVSVPGGCGAVNHSVIGHEEVLHLGFEGILEKVRAAERRNGTNALYRGMKRICKSVCNLGEKYAAQAERLLQDESSGYDAEDLRAIIRVCRKVPAKPAGSFTEAVQALWFSHLINVFEDHVNANSLGRLDQILYPYYAQDIRKGEITKEKAFELICCLWIKLYRDYDVQQVTLGGCKSDGSSAVNELSYLMLDATQQCGFIRCLSVRFSHLTEQIFLRRAMEVVGDVQKGIPFFFNDDVMIPALIRGGIDPADAYDYAMIGCVETAIPGKSCPYAACEQTNVLKAMEFALNDGHSMLHPERKLGLSGPGPDTLDTYEKFEQAVLDQIGFMLRETCRRQARNIDRYRGYFPRSYKSLLTKDCIENGRDYNDFGPRYTYFQYMLAGIPNLADSLMVIKKMVFEDQRCSLREVRDILMADFPDEAIRQEWINKVPKYGNDNDEVDSIAVRITDYACDILEECSRKTGLMFHAQPFTFMWMVQYGEQSAASADGRRKGECLAYSVSPMSGRDFNGLTAVFNSLCKLPTRRTAGTTSAIVEVDPKLFCGRNIDMLTDILQTAGRKGLSNVQFNVVDAKTLADAKVHPEKYNNLAVRVSGFSQKFNLLSPELQDHIISRTKHRAV